jgi:serine/threonine-protein phosphatase 2A regulatory subunit B
MASSPETENKWKFAQCFGDKGESDDITEGTTRMISFRKLSLTSVSKADIISAVEFDHTGDYLATGDKGGRVVLFERNESVSCIYSFKLSC